MERIIIGYDHSPAAQGALSWAVEYVSTPVNWKDGDQVVISPATSDDEASEKFPLGFTTLKPYLRLTPQPGK